ncbi:MAG: DNA-binding response regulator, partial [Acidobacteria bacterium]
WEVCGEAVNGADAVAKIEYLAPDLAVLDLGMPQMNGLQAAREIYKAHPQIPLILLTVQEVSNQLAEEAESAGFRGAVSKSTGREVVQGVEALLRNETFFCLDASSNSP